MFRRSPQKPLLLVSDLPSWGRVALASAAPIVEASGFQACSLPTALLSTHGAYPGFVIKPQTDFLDQAWDHLKSLSLPWAGVSFGFVGAAEQFAILQNILDTVADSGGLVLVDPILGDNGKRYALFGEDYVPGFQRLARRATVITPNLTEAALLLGRDPQTAPQTEAERRKWLTDLSDLGPRYVLLTSAPIFGHPEQTGVAWFDREKSQFGQVSHRKLGTGIPGTGDALAARLIARLCRGEKLSWALKGSVKSTWKDLRRSRAVMRPALWGPDGPLKN